MKFERITDAKFAPFKKSLIENPGAIFGGKVETGDFKGSGNSDWINSGDINHPDDITTADPNKPGQSNYVSAGTHGDGK